MNYWSWSGNYIGYQVGDYLYSKKGKPVGVFLHDELYNFRAIERINRCWSVRTGVGCVNKKGFVLNC